jgi:hypothetical protein
MATVLEKGLVEKAIKIKLRNTIHNSLDLIRDDINKLEVLFQKILHTLLLRMILQEFSDLLTN